MTLLHLAVAVIFALIMIGLLTRIVNLRIIVPIAAAVFVIVGLGIAINPALDAIADITTNMFGGTP